MKKTNISRLEYKGFRKYNQRLHRLYIMPAAQALVTGKDANHTFILTLYVF